MNSPIPPSIGRHYAVYCCSSSTSGDGMQANGQCPMWTALYCVWLVLPNLYPHERWHASGLAGRRVTWLWIPWWVVVNKQRKYISWFIWNLLHENKVLGTHMQPIASYFKFTASCTDAFSLSFSDNILDFLYLISTFRWHRFSVLYCNIIRWEIWRTMKLGDITTSFLRHVVYPVRKEYSRWIISIYLYNLVGE